MLQRSWKSGYGAPAITGSAIPLDESGGHTGIFAPRLMRYLAEKLQGSGAFWDGWKIVQRSSLNKYSAEEIRMRSLVECR
jgi:hypothetical protein